MFDRDDGSVTAALQSLMNAPGADGVEIAMGDLVASLGYGGYAFGMLWGLETAPEGVATLVGGNMVGYVAAYFAADFAPADPVVRRLRNGSDPVLWSPFIADPRLGGPDSRMVEIAALLKRHGIAAGVSIPAAIDALGCRAGLSVSAAAGTDAATFDARFAANGWVLRLAALAVAAAMGRQRISEMVPNKLSTSERLVLVALTQGLRPRDIAERLGKSEHTIRNQIVSAQQRLEARTKEEAIVKALRFGLIQL